MLDKAYDPQATEDRIYKTWEDSGAFKADVHSRKKPFTISMPPPNATGNLHLGHAVMLALEDIFIRFQRMQGREALWVPGTDHAAIATENMVIKLLRQKGIADPRKQLGREKLVAEIADFVGKSRSTIQNQVRKMGSSCDWSRERYTMDPMLNRCVNEVFVKMRQDGLIYRGHRIVNWDPKLQTTVSDDEVNYQEEKAPFYTFQYGPFQIGTSRPETKFGDKYVVMHPDDKRYKNYAHGETFECEWINGPARATIIKDKGVDPEFGTGVMTITPWHDHADFEIAQRHGLEKEQIIDFNGKLMEGAGEFAGMPIEKARPLIVEKLKSKGLLVKTDENYVHNKAINSRGGGSIEPQIKLQWFIDVDKPVVDWKSKKMSLKEIMHDVVHSGAITIVPERFNKTYFHWIDNLRDWCISRQIWWGHRIPVWYKGEEAYSGTQPPKDGDWIQEPDTLDTWFSAALWTWSTLLEPSLANDHTLSLEELMKCSPDFQKFHPTQVLETGYDILFFWVARMILMTTYATGQVPFETVYMHGLIRTRDGRKMSKSDPETMIDPLDMIAKYGADALRLSMIVGQSPGNDSRLYEEKIAGYRNFINKLWNASRFILMKCNEIGLEPSSISDSTPSSIVDQALMFELIQLRNTVTSAIEHYRLSEAGDRLYNFAWEFFCDWYLELSKGTANPSVLITAMREILQLLHPYCPFVTEELWKYFKEKDAGMLITHPWPLTLSLLGRDWERARNQLDIVIDVIKTIRKLRTDQNIGPGKKLNVFIHSRKHAEVLESQKEHIVRMAKLESIAIDSKSKKHADVASAFLSDVEVHLSLEGAMDAGKAKESLTKEKANLEGYLKGLKSKLENKAFVDRAPKELVEAEKKKMTETEEKLKKIDETLAKV